MRAIILATVITITMGIAMADPIDKVKERDHSWSTESAEHSCQSNESGPFISSEGCDDSSEEIENSVFVCAVTALKKLVNCFKNGFDDKALTCMVTEVKELIACFKKDQRPDIYDIYDITDALLQALRLHH